jgi:hypothetical protein
MVENENVDGITSNNGWSNITVMGYMGISNPADTALGHDQLNVTAMQPASLCVSYHLTPCLYLFHVLPPPNTSPMSMTPKKCTSNDENATFINSSGPPTKKPCRVLQEITPEIRNESRRLWLEKERKLRGKRVCRRSMLQRRSRSWKPVVWKRWKGQGLLQDTPPCSIYI